MSYCRKLFIVMLLVLSLPVQSYAAISMKCVDAMTEAGQGATPHAEQNAPEHHHEMPSVAFADGQHHHGGSHQNGSHHAHACSACASCCFGVGLPVATSVALPLNLTLTTGRIAPSAGVVSFLTGGIERPPRASLV